MTRRPSPRGVRLKDIARRGDVSLATVSRVLRGDGADRFSPETRRRVLDAARELGWVPNRLVQGIQTGRTGTVGVLALPLPGHWQSLLESAHAELLAHETVPLALYPRYEAAGTSELAQLRQMMERRVDAIACWPLVDPAAAGYLVELCAQQVPVITIDFELPAGGRRVTSVRTRESTGMNAALKHLATLGHRRVGYLGVQTPDAWATHRRDAFTRAAARRKLEPAFVHDVPKHHPPALDPLRRLLRQATAVVAGSEQLALVAWELARESAIRVPGDLSIVAFGQPRADYPIWPHFTVVDQRPELLGREVARLLLSPASTDAPAFIDVDPVLVPGRTTASPGGPA
jgi:DNA-binding LacI/PurR family transcriptional regulator